MPPFRMNPPLGLPILASVLNNAGHSCEVFDLEALAISPDSFRARLLEQRATWPDVMGVSALTLSARGAKDTVRAIRDAGYEGRVVVGGVHATLVPSEPFEWGADTVVTGECEGNIVQILEGDPGLYAGKRIPIELVPAPDWRHHSPAPDRYQGNYPKVGYPEGITMWSRGCPGHCIFCGNTIFGKQPSRYRPPEAVEAELIGLKSIGLRALFVYDDELVGAPLPKGWMDEVADRIAPLGFAWKAQGRCSKKHITRELLDSLRRGGCEALMWGVESFSQNVLTAVRKGTTPDDIWHSLRLAKEAGIKNWLFTMIGNYRESEADLALTADCLHRAYDEGLVDYRQTTVVTALPGTELWDIQHREGWFTPPPESGSAMHTLYQDTPWLSAEQMRQWGRRFDQACPVGFEGRWR